MQKKCVYYKQTEGGSMSHTSSKITEETVYQTYLAILRKEEGRKVRDSFVRQKFGKIPNMNRS